MQREEKEENPIWFFIFLLFPLRLNQTKIPPYLLLKEA